MGGYSKRIMVTASGYSDLYASQRFLKAYPGLSLPLQRNVEGSIHDVINGFRADPKTALRRYDRVEHCKSRIFETDISGKDRLLFCYDENRIIMLDVGGVNPVKLERNRPPTR